MIKKFPFGDTLLQDLGVLVLDKVTTYPVEAIIRLAKRFPQLELSDSTSLDQLKDEFLDFTLPQIFLPQQSIWLRIKQKKLA